MNENSCTMLDQCRNSGKRCDECLAFFEGDEEVLDMELPLLYVPNLGAPKKHPLALRKVDRKKMKLRKEGEHRRSAAVQARKRQTRAALKVEDQTRTLLARATHRSGATFGDGDSRLVIGGEELSVGIDDKYHSTARKTVSLTTEEIDKARRQGCFIVVTLANGRKFAVAEFDYFINAANEIAHHNRKEGS